MPTPSLRWCLVLTAAAGLQACAAVGVPPPPDQQSGIPVDLPFEQLAEVAHPPLDELSGLLASERFPGIFWAINDSGAEPALFALDAEQDFRVRIPGRLEGRYVHGQGTRRAPWPGIEIVDATLVDWEALARIDELIYLADLGNNGNARRDLGLWELEEPEPETTEQARPIRYLQVHYPEQESFPGRVWEWDCEAVFAADGLLYAITKHRRAGERARFEPGARLYRLDPGRPADQSTPLELVARHDRLRAATGADLSPDGTLLAVLTYSAVWLFPRPGQGDDWFSTTPFIQPLPVMRTRQVEAVSWDGNEALLIANEPGSVFRLDVRRRDLNAARAAQGRKAGSSPPSMSRH